jgi:DNA-binding response OmpR family regulator
MTGKKISKNANSAQKRILIIEDDRPMLRALEMKFLSLGFGVTTAENGELALAEFAKKKFDIALLDLIMPVKDGFDVLEELKKQGDKTPVIVSTNLSQQEDITRAKDLGAIDYFVKSDTPMAEVVKRVKTVLKV